MEDNIQRDTNFENLVQQYPSIKITKNTKRYNFEFRILSNDIEEMDMVHSAIVEKIEKWENKEKVIPKL